ncbi:DUF4433 domain-containing protein [Nocardiopsis gilva YIM 90087]|uniref:DUF4433 domain-containing protein n=1 Tax=Nocardiopsis gilva YIM 90087 TaxID=1235441 RepID=A0A223S0G7_9ACTN|nr:DarT ssDNA thymidine ADP-ribosyltransferase family protein [Nocardiopsis gilva]ASU81598.1 DUF4433 domain-containing protein [Nocardiopsis gilva YIM 90087]
MTSSCPEVADALRKCAFTRLAHFTPARNLSYILGDGLIRSSADLALKAPDYFSPTDRERFDGHPDKICCTFQYPNGYYLAQARAKPEYINYPDWVCLFLEASLVTRPGTLFAPHNAAKDNGAHLKSGGEGLLACFANRVGEQHRRPSHLPGAATDLQAEALVPGPIDIRHVTAVAVPTTDDAANECSRLRVVGQNPARLSWIVSDALFDRDELRKRIHGGNSIPLASWEPSDDGERR